MHNKIAFSLISYEIVKKTHNVNETIFPASQLLIFHCFYKKLICCKAKTNYHKIYFYLLNYNGELQGKKVGYVLIPLNSSPQSKIKKKIPYIIMKI